MSVLTELKKYLAKYQMIAEAQAINSSYVSQFKLEDSKKNEIKTEAKRLATDLFNAVLNVPQNNQQQIANFLIFVGLNFGIQKMQNIERLLHDSLAQINFQDFIKAFINTSDIKLSIKTVDVDVEKFEQTLNRIMQEHSSNKADQGDWDIIRKSFVKLEDQSKLIINNFNGTTESKVIDLDPKMSWHVATVLGDEDFEKLKSSKLWNRLEAKDQKALEVSNEKDGLKLRGACPYLGFAKGSTKHCGNVPSLRKGDIILVLWDSNEKAHSTVVISGDGKIRESKGMSNTKPSPNVAMHMLWLINHKWVEGIDDLGAYAPQLNFHISDIDDKEIVSHYLHHSDRKLKTEFDDYYIERIDKLKSGELTIQEIFDESMDDYNITFAMVYGLIGKDNFEKYFINDRYNLKEALRKSNAIEYLQQVNNKYIENSLVQNTSIEEGVKTIEDWFDIKNKIEDAGTTFKIFLPKDDVIEYIYNKYPKIKEEFEIIDVKMD